jgi:hypothetical protein
MKDIDFFGDFIAEISKKKKAKLGLEGKFN